MKGSGHHYGVRPYNSHKVSGFSEPCSQSSSWRHEIALHHSRNEIATIYVPLDPDLMLTGAVLRLKCCSCIERHSGASTRIFGDELYQVENG